jgi:hypothetical protein
MHEMDLDIRTKKTPYKLVGHAWTRIFYLQESVSE